MSINLVIIHKYYIDIKELESFKLSDAIKFHDRLNPRLWRGNKLLPEVKKQLELIADDFITELGISGLNVEDITLSGSNAAYTYTPNSDLDLHILVDMNKLKNDEVYRELFQAKKTLYNDSHDIKIHGVPVELYVQDTNEPVKSLGEYSLLRDEWIKIPKKRKAEFDQQAARLKYEKLESLIHNAMKSKKAEKIDELLKTIKRYRQAGLDKAGEFSPENLAYKALRNKGYIQKLYDLRNLLHTKELSIENIYVKEDYHPNAKPRGSEYEKDNVITEEAWLDQLVKDLKNKDNDKTYELTDAIEDWHTMNETVNSVDVILASNEAKPFKTPPNNIKILYRAIVPKNRDINSIKSNGKIVAFATDINGAHEFMRTIDVMQRYVIIKKEFRRQDFVLDYTSFYETHDPDSQGSRYISEHEVWMKNTPYYKSANKDEIVFDSDKDENLNEVSGYIPNEKQKNDPRFSNALTIDVKPNSIKKNAKAFGFNVSRAGIPPLLRK